MTVLNSYPKVYALGHRSIRDIFSSTVSVQEKVDGSQFSFGVVDGELLVRSKGASIDLDNPPKLFGKAVETVKSKRDMLEPGWVYRGEVLDKPKHNVLAYDRVPIGNVILFDIMTGLECYENHSMVEGQAQYLGLEAVPELYSGKVDNIDQLKLFLDRVSILGGAKIEGFVVKNYTMMTDDKKMAVGKFVSEAFKEIHNKEWKSANPSGKDFATTLFEKYTTPARWNKAIQHLRDAGQLDESPRDIGPLLQEINADVLAECGDEIKDALFKHFWKQGSRVLTMGFPEWYKEQLMSKSFGEE